MVTLWFSNRHAEKGAVRIGGSVDGVTQIVEEKVEIPIAESTYYNCVVRTTPLDAFQYSLMMSTYANVIWRAADIEVIDVN